MKYAYVFFLLSVVAVPAGLWGQDASSIEIQELIDQPTAGVLEQGQYSFDARFFPLGGTLVGLRAGIFQRFMIGVSYGGRNIIGRGDPEWNELPGVLIKFRLFEETLLPAVVLGFDSQGLGLWIDSLSRYEMKAKGLFACASKNFSLGWAGTLGLHAGANFNSFEDDDDRNLNGYVGIDKSVGEQITLLAEYNLGLDDNNWKALGEKRGYFNAGVRWLFAKQLGIEFNFKDLLVNQRDVTSVSRELRIRYVETL